MGYLICGLRAACFSLLTALSCAWAQEKSPIVLGQSGEFSGQGVAKENTEGARAYFEAVNRSGGVFGRKVVLKTYDDGRDIKRTVDNTERLIRQDKVFALFGYRSTPSVEAVLPLLSRERVPLVAPFSGSRSIRSPLNPLVFHMRASYHQEAGKLIQHLVDQGVRKIALLHQDDSFGSDVLSGYESALAAMNIKPLVVAKFDRKTLDVGPAVKLIAAAQPEAVAMSCSPKACVEFIKQTRAIGGRGTMFLTPSNVNSDEFVRALGADGRGVVVSQVVPHPWGLGTPLVREFQQAIKDSGEQTPVSYSSFEGYIAAKLVVAALRSAGPDPTRERFVAALEAMREFDLGGMFVRFAASNHQGSNFVDLTMIGHGGKYVR